RRHHGGDDHRKIPPSARGGRKQGGRHHLDRRRREVARSRIRDRAGSAARIYQDRLAHSFAGNAFGGGARISIASWMDSIARSAARAPCAIKSSARWKSNQPTWPTRGAIRRSGGSPASLARVMRSCMMLKASTITVEMPGRPALPKNSRLTVRSAEKSLLSPRLGG